MSGILRGLGRRLHRRARNSERAAATAGVGPAGAAPAVEAGRLGDLVDAHGASVPGCMLVLMSLTSALPLPGVGTLLGSALVGLALFVAWRGPDAQWAWPERLRALRLPATAERLLTARLALAYFLAARHARTRWSALSADSAQRLWWLLAAVMGVLIALPIPFGNVLPALAGTALGLGLVARDGAFLAAGAVLAVAATAFAVAMGAGAWAALGLLLA